MSSDSIKEAEENIAKLQNALEDAQRMLEKAERAQEAAQRAHEAAEQHAAMLRTVSLIAIGGHRLRQCLQASVGDAADGVARWCNAGRYSGAYSVCSTSHLGASTMQRMTDRELDGAR
jgi:DNA repair exonuclease SbcCD ATPase subunit